MKMSIRGGQTVVSFSVSIFNILRGNKHKRENGKDITYLFQFLPYS